MFIPRLLPRTIKHSTVILKQNNFLFARFYSFTLPASKMADMKRTGLPLQSIVDKLEDFASTKSAEAWDNVGLLIDPMETKPITKLLLTNDLTEDVMKEAVDLQVGMIVSYHPPIFKALKTVSARTWKERIVVQCIRNGIALFSPHTSWDVSPGGVSDWLSRALPIESSEPVPENGAGRLSKLTEPLSVREAIQKIKTHTGMPHLRLALAVGKDLDSKISTMASCAGAGTSVLAGVKADLYLTGEMLHHDVLEAAHNGSHVVLCNHSDSERGFLRYFSGILQDKLLEGSVEVLVSKKDADPLQTV